MSISTLNDDLNILQNLAIPVFNEDVDVIQKLDDEPNDVGGLTAAELKAKFDEAGNRIKTYLNETLVPSISETVAEAEKRAEAEAARVLAEEQRVSAEQARVAAEVEREQAEAKRRTGETDRAAAEAARKTAEDARVLAEQKRVDTDSGIVAQATSAAKEAENAANKAVSAAIHQPIVGDNGNWYTWSLDAGSYVDTGIYAGGDAPYIGANGNWYVGQTDTGVSATSSGVYVGSGDMPGGYNLQIDPEGEETDFIPYIGANGNWFVGDTDLNVPATGPTGPVGDTGATGPEGPAGSDGKSAYAYAVEGGYTGTEAEFAAKLAAEKFANPNALTFTGAVTGSYDGSAPLSVEIPSGGGGLTITNAAAVGQTVKITAVDENGQPTEWEAVNIPEQVQPDWNQNDSTAADYVKNRTHYEEITYVDHVLNMEGTAITGFSMAEVGETMAVKINGVESAETVKEAKSSMLGVSYKYIGNIDIDSLRNGGTGWCVLEAQEGVVVGFANPDTAITIESIVVHKINDKFINSDGFARMFNYHFKGNSNLYKTLYNDGGDKCLLYRYNNIILPESGSQLLGFMGEVGISKVESGRRSSCFVTGVIINSENGNITTIHVILGTDTSEMEELAANYGYVHTTNPNA